MGFEYSLRVLEGAMYGEHKRWGEVPGLHTTGRAGRALRPGQRACRSSLNARLLPRRLVTLLQRAAGQLCQGSPRVRGARGQARRYQRRPAKPQRCDGGEA